MVSKSEKTVIAAVTIGGVLEWYEFFLFIYLSPIIARHFFGTSETGFIQTLSIFAIGFLSRPLGALLFGHLGDRRGRKPALLFSIIFITLPTIAIAFIPSYAMIGILSPLTLLFLRFLQGIPVGSEITGAMCYLYEEAPAHRKTFLGSWTFFGSQIGALLCTIEAGLLQTHLTPVQFQEWGLHLSFLTGGCIGLLGCLLRYRLRESPVFLKLKEMHEVSSRPIYDAFSTHKGAMARGFFLTASMMSSNFLIFFFFPSFSETVLNKTPTQGFTINGIMLLLSVIILPFLGKLGDKVSRKLLFFISVVGIVVLAYPLFYTVSNTSLSLFITLYTIAIFLSALNFAILPFLMANLFPSRVRYTCIGVSYNLCSSLLGGTSPILAIYLINKLNTITAPAFIITISSLMTLGALIHLKERDY